MCEKILQMQSLTVIILIAIILKFWHLLEFMRFRASCRLMGMCQWDRTDAVYILLDIVKVRARASKTIKQGAETCPIGFSIAPLKCTCRDCRPWCAFLTNFRADQVGHVKDAASALIMQGCSTWVEGVPRTYFRESTAKVKRIIDKKTSDVRDKIRLIYI